MRARRSTGPTLPHASEATLPSGQVLMAGTEFTVKGEGRYRFSYLFIPDGSITAYGPEGSKSPSWRSFLPTAITTVHRKTTTRKTTQ